MFSRRGFFQRTFTAACAAVLGERASGQAQAEPSPPAGTCGGHVFKVYDSQISEPRLSPDQDVLYLPDGKVMSGQEHIQMHQHKLELGIGDCASLPRRTHRFAPGWEKR